MATPGHIARLGHGWKLAPDPANVGRQEGWFNRRPGPDAADTPVPGIIQQILPEYHGVVWYWLVFVPELAPEPAEQVFLHFGAVDYYAEVWMNGVYVGMHEGGETPFDLDVTAVYRPNAEWQALARDIAAGGAAVFLAPSAFAHGEDPVGWLPLSTKGTLRSVWNWLYHREDVAKRHPVFDGLPAGILDWDYYAPVIPDHFFEGQVDTGLPADIAPLLEAIGYTGADAATSGGTV